MRWYEYWQKLASNRELKSRGNAVTTTTNQCREFYELLFGRLVTVLADPVMVRTEVESRRHLNSFPESCFCKSIVLPVVDLVATEFLTARFGARREAVRNALRCEGYATPMYECGPSHVGFSSHSRSNSYHPGDKSGRRTRSRRSPDFCIRYTSALRLVGEMKYVETASQSTISQVVRELRDYLSIEGEPTSDWGHDCGWGLVYAYGGDGKRNARLVTDWWDSDRIAVSVFIAN